jgi:AP endonuclease-2
VSFLSKNHSQLTACAETKITRDKVARQHAILKSYDSFFSSNRRLPAKGYSGTAIFTKRTSCVPLKAEEGISGITQADSKTIPASQHVGGYPSRSELSNLDLDVAELRDLDIEGRATVVDLGLFVLINLYCPNVTNEERMIYKIAFNAVVEARVRALIKQGRQVMVVGDMNICSREIDHADPSKSSKDNAITEFTDTKPRQWFNRLIAADGILVDTTRVFHPNRKGMFTCG